MTHRSSLFVCSIALCLIAVIGCENRWTNDGLKESKKRGDKIVAMLEEHFDKHSCFPSSLALIPAINNPTVGTKKWEYLVKDSGENFVLSFEDKNRYPTVYFDSKVGYWIEDR
jgi:hypothetical protein